MHRIIILGLCVPLLWSQPATLIISNSAKPNAGMREARVAPGSLINLRVPPLPQFELRWFNSNLALSMQPAGGASISVPILQVLTSSEIRAKVPDGVPAGSATFVLRIDESEVARSTVRVVPTDVGIFTIGGDGFGPAKAQQAGFGRLQMNGLTQPAQPGDYVVLWATGLGAAGAAAGAGDVKVMLGEDALDVLYAGPAPGLPGVDQINVRLPDRTLAPDGCYVPLRVSINTEQSNLVTLSKTADGAPCTHPLRLAEAQMKELDEGRTVPIGSIGIYSLVGPPPGPATARWDAVTRMDHADASFSMQDAAAVATTVASRIPPPAGQCTAGDSPIGGLWLRVSASVSLGDRVRLSRGAQSVDLLPPASDLFSTYSFSAPIPTPHASPNQAQPSIWTPGTWTIDAPGIATAGPLNTSINVPAAIAITNLETVSAIDRSQDLAVEWNGQDLDKASIVTFALGGSRTVQTTPFSTTTGTHSVTCTAQASAGRLVIPMSMLREFDKIEKTVDSAATVSINVQTPAQLYALPQANADPIPTTITQSSGQFFGVSIR